MSNPVLRTLFGTVELRPVVAPAGSPQGARVFVLLPELDELLGVPGFGLRNPIRFSRTSCRPRPFPAAPNRKINLH
jgi:hypothetical protein